MGGAEKYGNENFGLSFSRDVMVLFNIYMQKFVLITLLILCSMYNIYSSISFLNYLFFEVLVCLTWKKSTDRKRGDEFTAFNSTIRNAPVCSCVLCVPLSWVGEPIGSRSHGPSNFYMNVFDSF